jgi:NADH:ubiquinone oxidoreductase subunit F (NADH-binding)/Pyruvate/2-oxoacid:ferredoxin oxidoreductase delta subunit/(2Fe-2S) ferredoxin
MSENSLNIENYKVIFQKILEGKEQKLQEADIDVISQLKKEKVTKLHLFVGFGSCGKVAGAEALYDSAKKYCLERSLDVGLVKTGCLGICSYEPLLDIQLPGKARISYKNVHPGKIPSLLDDVLHGNVQNEHLLGQYSGNVAEFWPGVPLISNLPFFSKQTRWVLNNTGIVDPCSIEEYMAKDGYKAFSKAVQHYTFEKVLNVIEKSGLRGRAGAGFPTGKKWNAAFYQNSDQKFLICNAEESDPGAFMDRTIIEGDPHKLIEGMAIGAYAIGARKAYIFIRTEYELAVERLTKAIDDAKKYGLLGENILNSGYSLDIILMQSPGAFICGEETALVNTIEGKRGMPKPKPPYPIDDGLFGKPTVVNNVETLANVPGILHNGPEWFHTLGTKNAPGTKVFSLSGKTKHTGLVEVPMGTNIKEIVVDIGGQKNDLPLKAVHIGGPLGTTIPVSEMDVPVDYESFKAIGAAMGSGGLVILDESNCMIDLVKYFMHYMESQSCGKCIPCREGTKRMAEILDRITRKPMGNEEHSALERFKGVTRLEDLARVMKNTSMCGFGHAASNPVLSTLKYFREEYEEHVFDRKCRAGVCKDLRQYYIDMDACTGCSVCGKKCPEQAIIGTPHSPYFIIDDKCTSCGICLEVCKFGAVFYK